MIHIVINGVLVEAESFTEINVALHVRRAPMGYTQYEEWPIADDVYDTDIFIERMMDIDKHAKGRYDESMNTERF
ncbi:MAG: hypothetical protein RRY26_03185 [Cellulosilyticaceae bacterium]